ncbi:MAG: hypothetical protein GX142_01295 [Chloroflexi bacterium]|jgi:hypothetical protein|nr:hypothetical protein [Chloroflexota bacterium]
MIEENTPKVVYLPREDIYYSERSDFMIMMSLVESPDKKSVKLILSTGEDEVYCEFQAMTHGKVLYSVPLRDALEQIKMGYDYKEDLDAEDVV